MEWIWLAIAGCMEITWAVGLKFTEGFSQLWPSLFVGAAMLASVYFLDLSLKSIPLGTAYAIWTGIGAAGTVIIGMSRQRKWILLMTHIVLKESGASWPSSWYAI